jgi:hypothetical protein
MTWEPVPAEEMPAVLSSVREGRCVSCHGPIKPEHGGLYCCDCDEWCEHKPARDHVAEADELRKQVRG